MKSSYLINANTKMMLNPSAHPARLNTAGKVKAPVPTMRLKIYTRPTYDEDLFERTIKTTTI